MLMKLITKKNTKAVLDLIIENEEMYFSELQRALDNVNPGTLNRILKELLDEQILQKRVEDEDKAMPKAYYSLTEYGLEVITLYEKEKKIESMKSKFYNEINGNVGQVINIDKADRLEINFKKGN